MICSHCAGEGVRIVGQKTLPSNCSSCVAESLIYDDKHPMGIMTFERASMQCSCLANDHSGETVLGDSPEFDKITKEHMESINQAEDTRREANFVEEQKKQEAIEYYANRVEELKKLDESGPGWILGEESSIE